MKTYKTLLFTLILLASFINISFSQTNDYFIESEDKATIYILRTAPLGAAINFRYFVDSTYVGKCNYGKYFKIYLKPGKHLIWAKAENRSFLEVDVEAGKTYAVNAIPKMGAFKTSVNLEELNTDFNERQLKRFKKYFAKRAKFITFTDEDLEKGQIKFAENVTTGLEKYNKLREKNKEIGTLTNPIDLEAILESGEEN